MNTILGVNHQFLYPASITDEKAHTETLKLISEFDCIDALDCWLWRGERSREELNILKNSGKIINYNIGDRFGEEICLPSSPDRAQRDRAYDIMMREISYALELGSKKIVFGSGPDMPEDHEGAKERFFETIMRACEQLPKDVIMALEPTDWDIDKHFLFGPVEETAEFIHKVRKSGFENIGMLIDMCHIPIMYETMETAIQKSLDTLVHIHLGNCVIKDKTSPYYGDKHVAWGYPGGEYDEESGIKFVRLLDKAGYFDKANTVSFEMRPIDGYTAEDSLKSWVDIWKKANEERM